MATFLVAFCVRSALNNTQRPCFSWASGTRRLRLPTRHASVAVLAWDVTHLRFIILLMQQPSSALYAYAPGYTVPSHSSVSNKWPKLKRGGWRLRRLRPQFSPHLSRCVNIWLRCKRRVWGKSSNIPRPNVAKPFICIFLESLRLKS